MLARHLRLTAMQIDKITFVKVGSDLMIVQEVVLCDLIDLDSTLDASDFAVKSVVGALSPKIIGHITYRPLRCASLLRDLIDAGSCGSDEDCIYYSQVVILLCFGLTALLLCLTYTLSSPVHCIGYRTDKFSSVLMPSALVIEIRLYVCHRRRGKIAIASIVVLDLRSIRLYDCRTLLHLSRLVIDDQEIQHDLRKIAELRSHTLARSH